jgi:hypothetical protein
VLPTDARQTYYWGFPFAFVGEGWQTSGAIQFFLLEGLADLLSYFVFWFVLIYIFWSISFIKRIPKLVSRMLWSITSFLLIGAVIIIYFSYPTFKLTKDYDWELINYGYKFIWQKTATN